MSLEPTDEVVVGIDIGGTGTRFVALTPDGFQLVGRVAVPTPRSLAPGEVATFLGRHLIEVAAGRRAVGLGIGASGPINADGVIQNPDTLPAFSGISLPDTVGGLLTGPVAIDNDAVCAALAEEQMGAARGASRSLHITLGTGLGVCLLDGGVPYRSYDGTHPEGGHIAVPVPSPPCYCGRLACWEQVASRRALQLTAAEVLGRSATAKDVIADLAGHAVDGDPLARKVFEDYGRAVAAGLSTLVCLYAPPLVVIGGSAGAYLNLFGPAISDSLRTLGRWIPKHKLIMTALDDYGGAIGGAVLVAKSMAERTRGSAGPTRG